MGIFKKNLVNAPPPSLDFRIQAGPPSFTSLAVLVNVEEAPSHVHAWNNKRLTWKLFDSPISTLLTVSLHISPAYLQPNVHKLWQCNDSICSQVFGDFDELDERVLGTRAFLRLSKDVYMNRARYGVEVIHCLHQPWRDG